jgi:hypothetical protein
MIIPDNLSLTEEIAWKSRSGACLKITYTAKPGVTVEKFFIEAENNARRLGYEGHCGGWLRYKVHDFAEWLKGDFP